MRPVIGITANYSFDGSSEFQEGIGAREQEWQLLADDYVAAVVRAGGLPVLLPVVRGPERESLWAALLDQADGVLFSGGSDVDPQRFGQTSTGKTGGVVPERDEQECAMARYVLEHTDKPVLGVCRGIQLWNAALGGTLYQHIPDAGLPSHSLSMYPRQAASHFVTVERDSLLYSITGARRLGVNSFHHMAVDRLAPTLKAVARAEDGLVEGAELRDNPSGRFFLAVQWHPEMMAWADPIQQSIVDAFVRAAGEKKEIH